MTDKNITLEMLRRWSACKYESRVAYFAGREEISARGVGEDDTLSIDDRLRVLIRHLIDVKGPDAVVEFAQDRARRAKEHAIAARYAYDADAVAYENSLREAIQDLIRRVEA